jgi:FkbM family methyltransferase
MPGSIRHLRHELTGRLRNGATHVITGMPEERRAELADRVRSGRASRALLRRASSWYGRAPVPVAGGIAHLLLVSTADLPLDHAHAGLIVRGTLEPPVQEALRRLLAPGDVFYDVGANVGFFTILGARLVGPEGRVVAFEPVPACARAVARNIALNDFAHAEIREEAVGAASGRAPLLVVGEASWSHLASTGRHADVRAEIDVAVASIDELVAAGEIPPPDVLKIDTEGAELQAIAGMRGTIERHRPAIVCELHDTNAEYLALMDELDYTTTNLDGPAPVAGAGAVHALSQPRERQPATPRDAAAAGAGAGAAATPGG